MDALQGVLEASPDAVLVVDDDGVVRRANRNVPDVLGYEPAELEGRMVEELLLEEDRDEHVEYRDEYMRAPEPRPMGRELDLYALRADGRSIPVEISLGPIHHEGDVYVVVTVTDITARKRREQELQRQNERLDEFASFVSHDLRNPLNVIRGELGLAVAGDEEFDPEQALAAAERMSQLVEDLLALARQGQPLADVEAVELSEVVADCWGTVDTADATLDDGVDGVVLADPGRLRQLLENLFRNAVEHGGKDVTVRVEPLEDGFFVADDGPGLSADDREAAFDRGYSTSPDGTGLGLAIAEEIAEAHGWQLAVTESDGGGARFEVTDVAYA